MSHYRIIITHDAQQEIYRANAPELTGCQVDAPTRAEALALIEEEIAAQVANIKEQGGQPPLPVDQGDYDGKLALQVTPELHRELDFLAKAENTELSLLLPELLTRAVAGRWSRDGGGRGRGKPRGDGRGPQREGQGARYHGIMENRAEFIDYVRRMESGGGQRGGGPRGGGRGGRQGGGQRG